MSGGGFKQNGDGFVRCWTAGHLSPSMSRRNGRRAEDPNTPRAGTGVYFGVYHAMNRAAGVHAGPDLTFAEVEIKAMVAALKALKQKGVNDVEIVCDAEDLVEEARERFSKPDNTDRGSPDTKGNRAWKELRAAAKGMAVRFANVKSAEIGYIEAAKKLAADGARF